MGIDKWFIIINKNVKMENVGPVKLYDKLIASVIVFVLVLL